MKSPMVRLGIWSLCLLMSGGCGSMQHAYENYVRDEILNRGQWTMTVDAGVGQRGLEGRVTVSGCVDIEQEAAHDEFVPINQPAPTPTPAGGYQPVAPTVRPAWTPRAAAPAVAPQATPTVRAPSYQPPKPANLPTYRPAPVPEAKTTPAPRWSPAPVVQPAPVRGREVEVAPTRPALAPTNTTRPAPTMQPAPVRAVPQPAAPVLGRPAAVPSAPSVTPAARPAAPQPHSASQPAPVPPRSTPPVQPVAKPTQGVTLPRGGVPQTSPLQASPAAAPVKGAPALAPAAPAGAGLRKNGRPRLNLPGQPTILEGSDDTSLPSPFHAGLTLPMLAGGAAEASLESTGVATGLRAQNDNSWDQPETAPATPPPAGFTVVHVPARYENKCETWGVAGVTVRVSVGNVDASATTDKDGRFYISDGTQLARLQAAGEAGVVTATLRDHTAQAALRLGGLNEVAAFQILDAMTRPSTEEVIAFVQEWKGTDAADLAVDRFGGQACGEFRADWDEMMATAEMERILGVQRRYQGAWSEVFAEPCSRELSLLPTLEDMASELGILGKP